MTISSLRILKWSLPADESADASHATPAAGSCRPNNGRTRSCGYLQDKRNRQAPLHYTTFSSDAMKKLTKEYEYGNCQTCGERMTEQRVKQDFWIKGKLIVLDGVPAGVCPRCGERVVKSDVGRTVAELLTNQRRKRRSRTLNVPVILFEERVA